MSPTRAAEARLVARATEMLQLTRAFAEARAGRGRLFILTGGAGVGKTALAEAFLREASAADPSALTLSARCVETQTAHRPYGPFRDLLAQLSDRGGETELAAIARREAPGWLPKAPPSSGRNALFDQYLGMCRAIARKRPVALFIDDLQWSDRSSLDLLARLGSALGSLPVLIVGAFEPVSSENAVSISGVQRRVGASAVELAIRELEDDAISKLAEQLLEGPLGGDLADWIVGAARGNPLRAEQFVCWLCERKTIRKRLFRYSARQRDLPNQAAKIEDVIVGRLEGLEPNVRWTLEAAALSGSVIDSAVVAGQMGERGEEVLQWLRSADETYGLIDRVGECQWPAGIRSLQFRFCHPLLRTLLHDRVSGKRREHLMSLAAETIERLAGENAGEFADEIAALYLSAGDHAKVGEWSIKAADIAERLYAVYEAEKFLRTAARTTRDELERLHIKNRLAELYAATGREPEAEKILETLIERCRDLDDRVTEVSAGTMLGWLRLERGDQPDQLSALAARLVDVARGSGEPQELVMALDLSCALAERIGRAEEALLMAEEALHVAEKSGNPEIVGQAAYRLAKVHVSWGNPEEGRALAQRALDLFEQLDAPGGVAMCHDLLGVANFRAGDWEEALHHWESALERIAVAGVSEQKIAMQASIAELTTLRGEFERADRLFRSGLQLATDLGDQRLALRCQTGIARLEFERGDYAAVLELTEPIRELLPESGAWKEDFQTTAIRALAYLELGDEVQAWQEAVRLEQLYQGKEGWFERRAEGDAVRIRVIDLDSDAWLAGMVAQQGIGETADKDPYGEGFLQYHRACVLARTTPDEARTAAERALELFSTLGAQPMLSRTRRFLKELPTGGPAPRGADEQELSEDMIDEWLDSFEG